LCAYLFDGSLHLQAGIGELRQSEPNAHGGVLGVDDRIVVIAIVVRQADRRVLGGVVFVKDVDRLWKQEEEGEDALPGEQVTPQSEIERGRG
jgi:hypothetical protein